MMRGAKIAKGAFTAPFPIHRLVKSGLGIYAAALGKSSGICLIASC